MQFGMYPQPYSIMFKGNLKIRGKSPPALALEGCSPQDVLSTLNAFDQNALGFTRAVDHQWWAKHGSYFLVKTEGKAIAYFRVSPQGMIGPLVVSDARWMAATLDLAIRQQMEITTSEHEIFVPGANTTAIAHLLASGYRYTELELLLSSHPMPGLAQVVFFDTDLL